MPDLSTIVIPAVAPPGQSRQELVYVGNTLVDQITAALMENSCEADLLPIDDDNPPDIVAMKFVLDQVIDLLERIKLTGDQLREAGQVLRYVEEMRQSL